MTPSDRMRMLANVYAMTDSPRPVRTDSYVWCDACGSVHAPGDDERGEECNPDNWRPVYIRGAKGETF